MPFFFFLQIFTPYFFPLYSRLRNTGPKSTLSVYLRTGLDHLHVIFNENVLVDFFFFEEPK